MGGTGDCSGAACQLDCCSALLGDEIAPFYEAVWSYCPSTACSICEACKIFPGDNPVFQPTADCYKCLVDHAETEQLPAINLKCANVCESITACIIGCG